MQLTYDGLLRSIRWVVNQHFLAQFEHDVATTECVNYLLAKRLLAFGR